jgi:3-hydroxyacyl-CoA dehydrogenase/enoyl-CoA hydratase/3-hydroxybutyryl-CoA epimerase
MQFIYGTGVETFLKRADELMAKYGEGFSVDGKNREAIEGFKPTYQQ